MDLHGTTTFRPGTWQFLRQATEPHKLPGLSCMNLHGGGAKWAHRMVRCGYGGLTRPYFVVMEAVRGHIRSRGPVEVLP